MAASEDNKYLPELMAEKDSIDPSFVHALRLVSDEIERLKNPKKKQQPDQKNLLEAAEGKPIRVECDIRVPVERHPKINFVGRLIGPGGATMKGIQEVTSTRIAVLGKGSVRDEKKAKDSGKPHYLDLPLHVHISALAPLPQAYMNLANACNEIQKLLQGDEDTEAQYAAAQGMMPNRGRGRGRGNMGGNPGMGRGGPRGGGGGRGGRGYGRGGPGGARGAGASGRGMGASPMGARGSPRGSMRGGGRGQSQYGMKAPQSADAYTEDYSYDSFGGGAAAASGGYDAAGYADYEESFDSSYDAGYGAADASGYGADGGYGDSYDNYGYSDNSYGYGNGANASSAKQSYGGASGAQGFRGKMGNRGGGMRGGRQKPY